MSTCDVVDSSTTTPAAGVPSYSRRVRSEDIDEHAAHVSGWHLAYDQMSAGLFQGELSEFNLDWMQVMRDRTNQALIKKGSAKPGTIAFSIPVSYTGNFYCGGHPMPDGNAQVAGKGQRKAQAGRAATDHQDIVLKLLAHLKDSAKSDPQGWRKQDAWIGESKGHTGH